MDNIMSHLRVGLLVTAGFLCATVESGSLISYFTVNDQAKEVSVKIDDDLIFKAEMVGEAINPHWTIQGRTAGYDALQGIKILSKTMFLKKPASCLFNDIFDCTASLEGRNETLSVKIRVVNCTGGARETVSTNTLTLSVGLVIVALSYFITCV